MSVLRRCMLLLLGVYVIVSCDETLRAAENEQEKVKPRQRVKYFRDDDDTQVFQMVVSPAAEPRPALKHRMWLRPNELKPGNAAMHYVRSFAENGLRGAWRRVGDQYGDAVDTWYGLDVAIEDLPLDKVRDASASFDTIIEQFIQPGTHCRDSDWGLEFEDLRGPESISFLLPEFQESRSISRMIALRTRLAIAERRYDDAIEHMRMNFRLGRDIGQEKLLVCNLIGIAIEGVAGSSIVDFIAAPDSPNLYWAMSEVPSPLVSCTEAVRLEMSVGLRIFSPLLEVETVEHSPKEWARLFREAIKVIQEFSEKGWLGEFDLGGNFLEGVDATKLALVIYPAAKQRLIESGMPVEQVEQMSVGQVMLMDTAREYRLVADEMEKWWYIPYSQSRERIEEAGSNLRESASLNLGRKIAHLLLPVVRAVQIAQIRSAWRRNALLVLEAIRMHAAETGELPRSLGQIQVVPVPMNPITTEPYDYYLDGQTAVLELPFSDGIPGVAYRYEVTLEEK